MITISAEQIESMARPREEAFLLECVSDWFALRETIYGSRPRLKFDEARAIARHVWDRVQDYPQPPGRDVEYELIHTVLQCGTRGATPEQLRRGLETYCRSLPCHEAGIILLEAICEPSEG